MSNENKYQLVTLADLNDFKSEIIDVIKQALKNADGPKKWLKTSEVKKLICISSGKLKSIRDAGLLAFTRIGGNIYYDPDDVFKLFEQNKIQKNEKRN